MTLSLHPTHPATAAPTCAAVVWVYDPWRERPRTAALATACALALCALVVWARLPFLMGAALCVLCVGSFAPAIAPVECRLDDAGAARRGLLGWERRPWREVRRVERVRGGALLSPFERPQWLDRTRAMLLPMPPARRDELRGHLDALRAAHGG